jgi:hypothetical protein
MIDTYHTSVLSGTTGYVSGTPPNEIGDEKHFLFSCPKLNEDINDM